MDALSITTGIITLYSVVWKVKRLKDSYTDAPEIIKGLERDCGETLLVILHTKCRLDSLDKYPTADGTYNPVDIRKELRKHIAILHPDVEALKQELIVLLRPPETNYDHIKTLLLKPRHASRLSKAHKKITERLVHFDRLLRSVDGENTDWIRRNSWKNSQLLISTITTRRSDSFLSFLSGESTDSGDAAFVDTEFVASEGTEILLDAITGGRQEDVKMILRVLRVSPNLKDAETGMFPLHVATQRGDLVMMKELLKSRALPDASDKHGQTALHLAARRNMKEAVELLLLKNANPNAEDNEGHTPLWYLAWYGGSPEAFEILAQRGADVVNFVCRDPDMPTALWAAAASPCLSTARNLLNAGANPRVEDCHGSTLLHKAGWDIASDLAPELLAKDADVLAKDREGKLPLHRAAAAGKTGVVERFLERMEDGAVEEKDGEGATALIHAAQKGSLPLVRCLTGRWRANCSAQDRRGNGALYYACANGHILVATFLLGLGTNINQGNKQSNTPLHVAARWGHTEIVRLLLQLGADCDARSNQEAPGVGVQVTPAEVAAGAGHEAIKRMINTFQLDE